MGARQRVVVDDAVDRLVLVLEHHVVPDRAQVVAQVDDPGRLDARRRCAAGGTARRSGAGDGAISTVIAPECSGAAAQASGRAAGRYHRRGASPRHRPAAVSLQPLRVGVLGAGTVGPRGRARVPRSVAAPDARRRLAARARRRRRAGRRAGEGGGHPRGRCSPTRPAHLVAEPGGRRRSSRSMGGEEPARTLVLAALANGRAVVTANKHLARPPRPGPRARVPRRRQPAALRGVGRAAASRCSARWRSTSPGNRVARVRGIVNGTTNFILTAMAREGRAYADVLAEAQALGLRGGRPDRRRRGPRRGQQARDPRPARVRGLDRSRRRVGNRPGTTTGRAGAPGITGRDRRATSRRIADEGRALRLLATARLAEDGALEASVVPTAVPAGSPFGRCDGVLNRVEVDADAGRAGRVRGPGRRRVRDRVGRARRPGRDRARARLDVGGIRRPRSSRSALAVRPVASECVAAPSGACYPTAD